MEHFKYQKNKKICIVANDAGGAEILKSFVYYSKSKFYFILSGPAIKIFGKKLNTKNYKKIIDKSDFVITGTSYKSLLEYRCIKYCKLKKKKVYSFLDHWVNYRIRFTRNDKLLLPDKIIVCDNEAKKIATKYFNNLIFMSNPYWKYVSKKFKNKKVNNINKYLYVSSNYNRTKRKFNDKWILNKLIRYLEKKDQSSTLLIRPHPSESEKKFNNFFLKKKINIIIDKNKNLLFSLRRASVVFGHNSMAMVLAKICGLRTININVIGQKNFIPIKYIDKFI